MSASVSEKLVKALKKIDRPGSFCISGSEPTVLPGLEVAELGPVGIPLTPSQAKELIAHCQQAPYGKGEETLVDTNVRRVWQMEPDQFTLTNPDWQRFLKEIVKKVQTELGLKEQKLESHLYNLLVYEKGSFFLPHRDGEKLDRMVATLVVVLPSSFQGGELVVRHEGQEQTVDFGSGDQKMFDTHFAAFYADCEHEVRPLRSGYRLCLIYNLTLAKSKKIITAPRTGEHIDEVAKILSGWSESDPKKLVIPLEHRYTKDGLVWDALKGVDRVKANVLAEAAKQMDCRAYLAILTLWESGSAEGEDYYEYGYRDRRRGWEEEEEEEEEEEDEDNIEGKYEMGDIYETTLTAEHWSDPEGKQPSFGEMDVEEKEVVPPESLTAVKPEENFEGYTGNAGMTLDRWYRHAAIVLWPNKNLFDVLVDCGRSASLAILEEWISKSQKARKKDADELHAQCIALAGKIIANWTPGDYYTSEEDTNSMMKSLIALDDSRLIGLFLRDVVAKTRSIDPGKNLAKICDRYGWATFEKEIVTAFDIPTDEAANQSDQNKRSVRLLEALCVARTKHKEDQRKLCVKIAEKTIAAIEQTDRKNISLTWYRPDEHEKTEQLVTLTRALIAIEQFGLLSRVVTHILATAQVYPLPVQISALKKLQPWFKTHVKKPSKELSQWLTACCEQLESLTTKMPTEPTDYCRDANFTCKCADCAELKRFLSNPQESVHRFPMREDRRTHLEGIIRTNHCDVDCKTERLRSPYSLVCTKNTASYKANLKRYHADLEHLAELQAIQASLPKKP